MDPRARPALAALAFTLTLTVAASPVAGQEATRHDIVARIVDGPTSQPLGGVAVRVPERNRAYVTAGDGTVQIRDVKSGRTRLELSLLGYENASVTVNLEEDGGVSTIPLTPHPVVLEGIVVTTDRLRARRNAVVTSVRAFDRDQLLKSGAHTIADFMRMQGVFRAVACDGNGFALARRGIDLGGGFGSFGNCSFVRGRPQPVSVIIDEWTALGGLDELAHYRPDEIYMVEAYGGGRQIRVYTNWFMERVATGRMRLRPVLMF